MDALAKTTKVQYEVKRSCEELREGIKNIYDWTQEMKEKEKKMKESEEDYEAVAPVRSQIENVTQNVGKTMKPKPSNSNSNSNENASSDNAELESTLEALRDNVSLENDNRIKSNSLKEKGNEMFKLGKYDEAIDLYTNAIICYDGDPNFYTNRAICYLKQERYDQCIEDCNKAITLDKKSVKAYYRRMQAYEGLGKNDKALTDCKFIIKMDPKNLEARKSLERINQRFRKLAKNIAADKPTFTNLTKNMDIIAECIKPAHLRSNKPLKRIDIIETIGSKDEKNYENSNISNESIPDEVLDKLFNNNNISYTEIKKPQNKIQDKAVIQDMNADSSNASLNEIKVDSEEQNDQVSQNEKEQDPRNIMAKDNFRTSNNEFKKENLKKQIENKIGSVKKILSSDLPVPASPAQFHTAWKELQSEEKFNYFRKIQTQNLNRTLGSGLEPDLLTDIFIILSDYYVKNKLSVHETLIAISQHDEFSILSLFLSKDDRDVLNGLLDFMKNEGVNEAIIGKIKYDYYLVKDGGD